MRLASEPTFTYLKNYQYFENELGFFKLTKKGKSS